jgi:hypothetical protein
MATPHLCCGACKQLMPQQSVTGSILAVDAGTFLPHASMETSPYRMQVFRKATKILAKLDLPMDLPRMRLIVVYSEVAARLKTSVSRAVAYIVHLVLVDSIDPSPEHSLAAYCSMWCNQLQDEDRESAAQEDA